MSGKGLSCDQDGSARGSVSVASRRLAIGDHVFSAGGNGERPFATRACSLVTYARHGFAVDQKGLVATDDGPAVAGLVSNGDERTTHVFPARVIDDARSVRCCADFDGRWRELFPANEKKP